MGGGRGKRAYGKKGRRRRRRSQHSESLFSLPFLEINFDKTSPPPPSSCHPTFFVETGQPRGKVRRRRRRKRRRKRRGRRFFFKSYSRFSIIWGIRNLLTSFSPFEKKSCNCGLVDDKNFSRRISATLFIWIALYLLLSSLFFSGQDMGKLGGCGKKCGKRGIIWERERERERER